MTIFPPPRWLKSAGFTLLVAIASPGIGAIRFINWWDEKTGPRCGYWQRWYAWTPTHLGRLEGPVVWLEPIERARWGDAILCRRPGDTSVLAPWEVEYE